MGGQLGGKDNGGREALGMVSWSIPEGGGTACIAAYACVVVGVVSGLGSQLSTSETHTL